MNRPLQTSLSKAYAALTQLSASQLVQAIARGDMSAGDASTSCR